MIYLVDANVLSEATKAIPDAKVIGWLKQYEPDLVVDPIILGEIQFGIFLLPVVHNLIVATRNTRDFRDAGVKLLDPFV